VIQQYYKWLCSWPSLINEHLPTLKKYGEECEHITEFGFWQGDSTAALLCARPKTLITYDIDPHCNSTWEWLSCMADKKTNFIFRNTSSISGTIEKTDLLFIDSWHVYDHLKAELKHSSRVRKYIICHDTVLYGTQDSGRNGPGLMPAVNEFLESKQSWKMHEHFTNCSGLTILKRRQANE
jgi:hypothetical protein